MVVEFWGLEAFVHCRVYALGHALTRIIARVLVIRIGLHLGLRLDRETSFRRRRKRLPASLNRLLLLLRTRLLEIDLIGTLLEAGGILSTSFIDITLNLDRFTELFPQIALDRLGLHLHLRLLLRHHNL